MPTKVELEAENARLIDRIEVLEEALRSLPAELEWTGYEADIKTGINGLVPGLIERNYRIDVVITAELTHLPRLDEAADWLIGVIENAIELRPPCSLVRDNEDNWTLKVDGITKL